MVSIQVRLTTLQVAPRRLAVSVQTGFPKWKQGFHELCRYLWPRRVRSTVRRAKALFFSGSQSRPARVVPGGSSRSGGGGNERACVFDERITIGDLASGQAVT